ncbi:MAG: hypothetical protein AAB459_03160 [Patescibacteria group bacterium]
MAVNKADLERLMNEAGVGERTRKKLREANASTDAVPSSAAPVGRGSDHDTTPGPVQL